MKPSFEIKLIILEGILWSFAIALAVFGVPWDFPDCGEKWMADFLKGLKE